MTKVKVCLNSGLGTSVNLAKGTESSVDLTLVSKTLVGKINQEVLRNSTVGSDHYPICIGIEIESVMGQNNGGQ